MFIIIERLESTQPVLQSQEGLLVWIKLGKELLIEMLRQVEAHACVVLIKEFHELFKSNLVTLLRGVKETLFYLLISLRYDQPYLLNACKLPVMGT